MAMGLRDEVQADIAEAFDADLADAVKPFAGGRTEISDQYDPVTGSYPETTISYSGRGVFGGFRADELGEHLKSTDTKLVALQSETLLADDSPATPKVDDRINNMKVVAVMKDPAGASWTLALRKT